MKYALVIAEKPDPATSLTEKQWLDFLVCAKERIASDPENEVHSEGCYMLSLSQGLQTFALVLKLANDNHISSRVLFFEEKPCWIVTKS